MRSADVLLNASANERLLRIGAKAVDEAAKSQECALLVLAGISTTRFFIERALRAMAEAE